MTRKLLTILCVLAWCMMSYHARGQISVGAKTGANVNQFRQPQTTMGVNFGVYSAYQLNPWVTVKFEPHYSLEGGGRPDYIRYYGEGTSDFTYVRFLNPSVRLHTLQLPVLVELTLPELTDQTVVPFVLVGFSYALTMSAMEIHTKRYDLNDFGSSSSSSSYDAPFMDVSYQKENVTDNYSRNQWNAWLGMGMKVKSGERTFGFDVRYRHGLNNLNQLRFASPGNFSDIGIPGTGGNLFSSTLSINFSMSILNLSL